MTASTEQPRMRRERRIIERPRLMKMLDECEARVILLHAPAGYGKTTLARQWARTLNGAIWVTLTAAHRDVARLAESIADEVDPDGGTTRKYVGEYLRARSNPQREAENIGLVLARQVEAARVQWVVLDDYHEVADAEEIGSLITAVVANSRSRFLIASRLRPPWATRRRLIYRELDEIRRSQLAMNAAESAEVLGRRPDLDRLMQLGGGWPAVLGLAASTRDLQLPGGVMAEELYTYIAEEIYREIPLRYRPDLLRLALAPEFGLQRDRAEEPSASVEIARELGLLSGDHEAELHPLIRSFLLHKLNDELDADSEARRIVASCLNASLWDRAFELILRFKLFDIVEEILFAAYRPLARSGHLATLAAFAESTRQHFNSDPPLIRLIDADVALSDGSFDFAADLAVSVRNDLGVDHPLTSHANFIIGQSLFSKGDLSGGEAAFRAAVQGAQDDQDEAEALYGWALAHIQGEIGDPAPILKRIESRRRSSALDLVRYGTVQVARKRFQTGLHEPLAPSDSIRAIDRLADPRARSSLTFSLAYAHAITGNYREALTLAERAQAEVDAFSLEFARPFSNWNLAFIYLGLRRFGAAEHRLQLVEDDARRRPVGHHVINARILRARLCLQTNELDRALISVTPPPTEACIPSLHGEYLATRALTLAAAGRIEESKRAAAASNCTSAGEVVVLSAAASAVGEPDEASCQTLFGSARMTGAWDPVVAAVRLSEPVAQIAAADPSLREELAALLARSGDLAVARRLGIRVRSTHAPHHVLSPRELEVIELLARGFRNKDVAKALVISESTTKVHVRHILEKLGVRTRAEAVARYQLYSD
jgi:ATP/maltotriose-dependent transcriptional regulator MalT